MTIRGKIRASLLLVAALGACTAALLAVPAARADAPDGTCQEMAAWATPVDQANQPLSGEAPVYVTDTVCPNANPNPSNAPAPNNGAFPVNGGTSNQTPDSFDTILLVCSQNQPATFVWNAFYGTGVRSFGYTHLVNGAWQAGFLVSSVSCPNFGCTITSHVGARTGWRWLTGNIVWLSWAEITTGGCY